MVRFVRRRATVHGDDRTEAAEPVVIPVGVGR
jgi:hypothetical protein